MIWEIVRILDLEAVDKKMKNDSLVSGLRYPLVKYYDERVQGSDWEYIKKHSNLYTKILDPKIHKSSADDFGEKIVFLLNGDPRDANISVMVKLVTQIDQLL